MQTTIRIGLVIVAATATLLAQGTRADYERADKFPETLRGKLLNADIAPTYAVDGRSLWYRLESPGGGSTWMTVDLESARKSAAFDHARLAASLSASLGKPIEPARLPIARLAIEKDRVLILLESGDIFATTPAGATLEKVEPEEAHAFRLEPSRRRRSPGRNGAPSGIVVVNKSPSAVRLLWIDGQGNRTEYGDVKPGARRSQHTFGGHVWEIRDAADRPIDTYAAADVLGLIVIGGKMSKKETPASAPANRELAPGRRADAPVSPDGRWEIVFEDHNALLRPTAGGAAIALTKDGSETKLYGPPVRWSPDSSRLVFAEVHPAARREVTYIESSPRDQLQPKVQRYAYLKPGDAVERRYPVMGDADACALLPTDRSLFENPYAISHEGWCADGSEFRFLFNARGHGALRYLAIDKSGRARALIDETSKTFVDYAGKFFLHLLRGEREALWMSERDGWNHLYRIDLATGAVKNRVTSGAWVVQGVERVDEDAGTVVVRAGGLRKEQDPYFTHFARIGLDGSGLTLLTEGDGTHSLTPSPDGKTYVDRYSRADCAPVTEVRRSADGSLIAELARADLADLAKAGWRAPERFVAKGRDGATDIFGLIHRPSNHDPSKHYPVIEAIYAGPHGFHVPKAFGLWSEAKAIAELGFIVVQIDGMGTSGRSKAFHDVCWKNLADAGFLDRKLWIRAAAAADPSMDLARVGIYGGSAGGQNALRALIDHHDLYKAAVADCGCHDNRMDKIWWNELWMGWPIGKEYELSSNVLQAHRMKGKLLLIVGEKDENVDPASTMQVVDALIRADKDFELLVVPGAGHGAAGTPYGRRRLRDFFVRNLLGVEPRRE